MRLLSWRPFVKGSLREFATVLHERDGKRWVSLPSKPQIDSEGRQRKDPATGKPLWTPVVEIPGRAERERFQAAALAAIDVLLDRGKP
jgi:hypothetical protein